MAVREVVEKVLVMVVATRVVTVRVVKVRILAAAMVEMAWMVVAKMLTISELVGRERWRQCGDDKKDKHESGGVQSANSILKTKQ